MTKIFITFTLLLSLFGCSVSFPGGRHTHLTAEMVSKGMELCKTSQLLSLGNTLSDGTKASTLVGFCEDNTRFSFKISDFKFERKDGAFGSVGRDAILKAQTICQENKKTLLNIWGETHQDRFGAGWSSTWFECSEEGATRSFRLTTSREQKPT
jgi:hypothetical protein